LNSEQNADVLSMYEKALGENIQWRNWTDWIPTQIQELNSKKS